MLKKALKLLTAFVLIALLLLTVGCQKKENKKSQSEASSQSSQSSDVSSDTESAETASEISSENESAVVSDTSSKENSAVASGNSSQTVSVSKEQSKEIEACKKTVAFVLDSVKKGDFDTVEKNLQSEREIDHSLGFDERTVKKLKRVFAEMDYKIISAESVSDTKAVVKVKVKSLDLKTIFKSYMAKAKKISQKYADLTPKQYDKKIDRAFNTAFDKGKLKPITKTYKLSLVKKDDKWFVENTFDFSKACLGGMIEISEIFM